MTNANQEQKRTLAHAEAVFQFIARMALKADPHTYEVVYTYVAKESLPVVEAIDGIIAEKGVVSQSDIASVYARSFSADGEADADGIEQAGEKVNAEIAKVMEMLSTVIGTTTANADLIDRTSNAVTGAIGPEGIKSAIEVLRSTAQKMRHDNSVLKNSLTESRLEISRLQEDLQNVRENSLKDSLTQVHNRKFFDEALAGAMAAESVNGKPPVALLMVDIDHFKSFNDKYGHIVGDQVLRVVARILKSNIKGRDTAARYGGEEFGVILPETSLQAADQIANTIRRSVMEKELLKKSTGENLGRITLSIGVAIMRPGDTPEALIARADQGLYAAKRSGRNRVICETDPEFESTACAAA